MKLPENPTREDRRMRYGIPHKRGKQAEDDVYRKLLYMGFRDVRRFADNAPWDLEVDGNPVEVKSSVGYPSVKRGMWWAFGIRGWRQPIVMPVIAYVLCLGGVPEAEGITHVIIPGPIQEDSYRINISDLEGIHRQNINNWALLQETQYPLERRANIDHLIRPRVGFPESAPYREMARLRRSMDGKHYDERKRICKEWRISRSL